MRVIVAWFREEISGGLLWIGLGGVKYLANKCLSWEWLLLQNYVIRDTVFCGFCLQYCVLFFKSSVN